MTPPLRLFALTAAAALFVGVPAPVQAQDWYWVGNGGSSTAWSDLGNWNAAADGSGASPAADDDFRSGFGSWQFSSPDGNFYDYDFGPAVGVTSTSGGPRFVVDTDVRVTLNAPVAQSSAGKGLTKQGNGVLVLKADNTSRIGDSIDLHTHGSVTIEGALELKVGTLVKTGTGTWILAGTAANHYNYWGGTTVKNGTLTLDGSTLGPRGTLTVNGGTVDGNGTTVAGILAPGASPGTLNFSGNLTLLDGDVYIWEIDAFDSDLQRRSGRQS